MTAPLACEICGEPYRVGAAFCAACGRRRFAQVEERSSIGVLIGLYLALLGVSGIVMAVGMDTEDFFPLSVVATSAYALIVLGFALWHLADVVPAYRRSGFSWRGYALILLASAPIVALVAGYVSGLSGLFGLHPQSELAEFEGRSWLWALLLVAIAPPLIEELAFRGILYSGLQRTFGITETFLISSFTFALLHLAVPSLVTHLPLGLYFCWLRHRSGSLWPSTFAHFCHNLGVCLVEWAS
ncbi:MAG: lysostaphin resistance A-like protein [Kofleriaceae bacterium]